jgi:hypothetical protein
LGTDAKKKPEQDKQQQVKQQQQANQKKEQTQKTVQKFPVIQKILSHPNLVKDAIALGTISPKLGADLLAGAEALKYPGKVQGQFNAGFKPEAFGKNLFKGAAILDNQGMKPGALPMGQPHKQQPYSNWLSQSKGFASHLWNRADYTAHNAFQFGQKSFHGAEQIAHQAVGFSQHQYHDAQVSAERLRVGAMATAQRNVQKAQRTGLNLVHQTEHKGQQMLAQSQSFVHQGIQTPQSIGDSATEFGLAAWNTAKNFNLSTETIDQARGFYLKQGISGRKEGGLGGQIKQGFGSAGVNLVETGRQISEGLYPQTAQGQPQTPMPSRQPQGLFDPDLAREQYIALNKNGEQDRNSVTGTLKRTGALLWGLPTELFFSGTGAAQKGVDNSRAIADEGLAEGNWGKTMLGSGLAFIPSQFTKKNAPMSLAALATVPFAEAALGTKFMQSLLPVRAAAATTPWWLTKTFGGLLGG